MEGICESSQEAQGRLLSQKNDVPVKLMGPIHALAMQLLAEDTIELQVTDCTKVGTKQLNDKHILVALSIDFYNIDRWDGMTVLW